MQKIKFKRIRKSDLHFDKFTYVDMHVHSKFSDGVASVDTIVKRARRKKIGISITDHNEIRGNIKAAKENKDILIIPGFEIYCKEGCELLFYFYTRDEMKEFFYKYDLYEPRKISLRDILEKKKDYNCLVSLPHPFAITWLSSGRLIEKNPDLLKYIDFIEGLNGIAPRLFNLRAVNFAHKTNKSIIGGSDAHFPLHIGNILTYTEGYDDVESFLNKIKRNEQFVIGKENQLDQNALFYLKVTQKNIMNPHWYRFGLSLLLKKAQRKKK